MKPIEQAGLHERLHAYMRELQINFACFDFIVPHEGESIFLEANCNGQWLWVQNLAGLQIGKAIADELLNQCTRIVGATAFFPNTAATESKRPHGSDKK